MQPLSIDKWRLQKVYKCQYAMRFCTVVRIFGLLMKAKHTLFICIKKNVFGGIIVNMGEIIYLDFRNVGKETYAWTVAFCLGLILFFIGIIYIVKKQHRRDIHYAWATFWEFLACWVLYIPVEIDNDTLNPRALSWVEGVFTALIKSFNMLFQNDYERVGIDGQIVFTSIYNILRIITNISMLLFAGAFILKFINGPVQSIKLFFDRRRYMYFFSTCNDKTLSIATSIRTKYEKGNNKKAIFFTCDLSSVDSAYRDEIDHIGAGCIDNTISQVVSKYTKSYAGMEIFLFNDSEEKNLIELEAICLKLKDKWNKGIIRIYVELLKTPWGLYDDYIKKYDLSEDIVVNFVRMEEAFVYNNLLKNSIFENAIYDGDNKEKRINAVIVGKMDPRNTEFLKALLHLSQMPGYYLNLTVIDSESGRRHLKQIMPEIGDEGPGDGDAIYHINYIERIDYDTDDFEVEIIKSCLDFTFAFVNTGDDLMNIRLALLMKAMVTRKGRSSENYTLQVVIHNEELWETWSDDLCKGINPVGSLKEIYNYSFVANSEIECGSEAVHKARHNSRKWEEYLNNEYNRHSVFARTLSYKYKIMILGENYQLAGRKETPQWSTKEELKKIWDSMTPEEIEWKKYEHMRWNMYTRTLGYRVDSEQLLKKYLDKDKELLYEVKGLKKSLNNINKEESDIEKRLEEKEREKNENKEIVMQIRSSARIHNDLVPFDDLPLEEKIKDNLELTDEVVSVLRRI